jgi:hypothetical protein
MAVTIVELKAKLARVQQELAEVSAALDGLGNAPCTGPRIIDVTQLYKDPVVGHLYSDPETIRRLADEAFPKMGIDITKPALTPREVQELMLREGVRPEDNILSRGIIEAREE